MALERDRSPLTPEQDELVVDLIVEAIVAGIRGKTKTAAGLAGQIRKVLGDAGFDICQRGYTRVADGISLHGQMINGRIVCTTFIGNRAVDFHHVIPGKGVQPAQQRRA
jgi:hypothetical protein